MRIKICFAVLLILACFVAAAQQAGDIKDSTKTILIRKADRLGVITRDTNNLTYTAGHVEIVQGNTIITCDSAIYNKAKNMIEAYGDVHINDADSVHTYSQEVRYFGSSKTAILTKHVKLTDGKGLLMTEELNYDLAGRLATYKKGATIYNGSTKLISQEGYYYTNTKDAYFKKKVVLEDPKYTMATDTLLYNTSTQIATFVAPTTINDGKTIINTSEGFYDLKNGNASFGKRTLIKDESGSLTADEMRFDKKTGEFALRGNVIRVDTVNDVTIFAGEGFGNDSTKKYLFTRRPVMIIKQDTDSVYITGDTLYLGRLDENVKTDSTSKKDSINKVTVLDTKKDSANANRFFQAFRNVKIFSDSLQAVGDSLYYSFRDSTFRLFKNPFVWANNSQISGDTIYLFTKNKKPDLLYVRENSYVISAVKGDYYNQVKSVRLNGYFKDGSIDYIRAKGYAESIYFIQDEDSAFLGVNKSSGDVIDMIFRDKELKKVVFRSAVKGTSYPMKDATDENIRLRGFRWQEARRPKNRAAIFGE